MSSPEDLNQLLTLPKVKDSIFRAGTDVLSHPEVQQELLKSCKEQFPQAAAAAVANIQEWAKDPKVQKEAKAASGLVAHYALSYKDKVSGLVHMGPDGLRVLAFGVGCAALVSTVFTFLTLLNPLNIIGGFFTYEMAFYMAIFAITTMLFEAPTDYLKWIPGADGYHNILIDKVKFLTEAGGRGLFYIFQGSLFLGLSAWTNIFRLVVGFHFMLIGILYLGMHYGILPGVMYDKFEGEVKWLAGSTGTSLGYGATSDVENPKTQ